MRPLAWGDSFGFRQVITRSRDVTETEPARRPQDPHDPVADLRQGRRADGREPDADGLWRSLHVAADGRHRRLRARREHDAAAAFLRGRRLHGAHAAHRRRARTVGIDRDACPLPADLRATLERAAIEAATAQRAIGPQEDAAATDAARQRGMTIREIDGARASAGRRAALGDRGARAWRHLVARGDPRVTSARRAPPARPCRRRRSRCSQWSIAILVVAQAAVVGLQVVGRHVLRQPSPGPRKSRGCCSAG